MKEGDMVRFAKWSEIDHTSNKLWNSYPKNHIGILIEHNKIQGIAHVLHEGEVIQLRAMFVEKAGRKDYEGRNENDLSESG